MVGDRALNFGQLGQIPFAVPDPAMENQDGVVYEASEGQVAEDLMALSEDVLSRGLRLELVEDIDVEAAVARLGHALVHLGGLVVPPDEPDAPRISRFQGQEDDHGLELVQAAVDPVPVENILGDLDVSGPVARHSKLAEQKQEVPELAVDVSEDLRRRVGVHDGWLCSQLDGRSPQQERQLAAEVLRVVRLQAKERMQQGARPEAVGHVADFLADRCCQRRGGVNDVLDDGEGLRAFFQVPHDVHVPALPIALAKAA
mmetsp:Transcript_14060/g.52749  ORF Transcript_14060/g.52749 Transcript_14060/m.52749 type:complete len:258 (-) Transcript_14060:610-1383(-)